MGVAAAGGVARGVAGEGGGRSQTLPPQDPIKTASQSSENQKMKQRLGSKQVSQYRENNAYIIQCTFHLGLKSFFGDSLHLHTATSVTTYF